MTCPNLYVTTDGDTLWLQCFTTDPDAEHGDTVRSLEPGDRWEEIRADITGHRCAAAPDDGTVDERAVTAAAAVFQRTPTLTPPDRDTVRAALAAAGDVFAENQDDQVEEMLAACGFAGVEVHGRDIGMRVKISNDLARGMVHAFDGLVQASRMENYVEWSFTVTDPALEEAVDRGDGPTTLPPFRRYTICIVKPDGQTPHDLHKQADARLAALHDKLTGIYDGDVEDFNTPESTVDYVVTRFRAVAESEAEASHRVARLESDLRAVAAWVDGNTAPDEAVTAIRRRLAEAA